MKFPSPCGDMVLKSRELLCSIERMLVSVPLRGYGFEIDILVADYNMSGTFPSPCGDMVLKLWSKQIIMPRPVAIRFRPLAGIWF